MIIIIFKNRTREKIISNGHNRLMQNKKLDTQDKKKKQKKIMNFTEHHKNETGKMKKLRHIKFVKIIIFVFYSSTTGISNNSVCKKIECQALTTHNWNWTHVRNILFCSILIFFLYS